MNTNVFLIIFYPQEEPMNSIDETLKDTAKTLNSKNVSLFLLDDHHCHHHNSSQERLEDEEDDLIEQMPIIDDDLAPVDLADSSKSAAPDYHQLIQVELASLHQNSNNKMLSSPESAQLNDQDTSFPDTQDTDLDVAHDLRPSSGFLAEMAQKIKELEAKNKHLQSTLEGIYEKDDLFMASSRRENEERENSIKLLQLNMQQMSEEKKHVAGLLAKSLLLAASLDEHINKRAGRIPDMGNLLILYLKKKLKSKYNRYLAVWESISETSGRWTLWAYQITILNIIWLF